MSLQTEKQLKAAIDYVRQHADETMGQEELNGLLQEYIRQQNGQPLPKLTESNAQDVYDWLELADRARSLKEKKRLLLKAREADPENLDVDLELLHVETKNDSFLLVERLPALLEKGKNDLIHQKMYFENRGNFYTALETRPYMRAMFAYLMSLVDCGMLKKACAVGEEMLRLNPGDNLGVRYALVALYAVLEDKSHALKLYKKYDNEPSAFFLLPLSFLSFKLGNLETAKSYLVELKEANPDLKKFLNGLVKRKVEELKEMLMDEGLPMGAYRPDSLSELLVVLRDDAFLWYNGSYFFSWAKEALTVHRKKAAKK